MNSSPLDRSAHSPAPLPKRPFNALAERSAQPIGQADNLQKASYQADDSTQFQDASGNVKKTKRLFKNRFEIVRRLGRGGFSNTYLAQDISLLHPLTCVIKHLKYAEKKTQQKTGSHSISEANTKTAFEIERLNRRFQKEARMMARLGRHSQLPRLLDHFADEDQFYLVQEHVPGPTLSQECRKLGHQDEKQVKQFLREMIPIIRHLHRQNLLHLDIKPSNIIRRSSDNKLVLIDFGAVRRYPDDATSAADKCAGTIGFAPAEQLEGRPTFASDIYALGVTCLYMLTLTSPLDLATSPRGQILRWQESVTISRHLKRILTKMLHAEAENRFQSIDELERALDLEEHYETLRNCITTEPYGDESVEQPEACLLVDYEGIRNRSQSQRHAASIRGWRQRRRQFRAFVPK